MAAAATIKLRIKVGSAEFDAEGPEQTVNEKFDRFMECVNRLTPPALESRTKPPVPPKGDDAATGAGASNPIVPPYSDDIASLMPQAFVEDAGGDVSLRIIPNTVRPNEDALLLLMYGIKMLKSQPHIGAVELGKAARQSGINLSRFTDAIARLNEYVRKGGQRRSTRYVLNNRGVTEAERLLREMFACPDEGAGNPDG